MIYIKMNCDIGRNIVTAFWTIHAPPYQPILYVKLDKNLQLPIEDHFLEGFG